jgi:L-threonylcarbamoyladenylate synthase
MKRVKINPQKPESAEMEMARDILQKGGVVVYPTDTLYGLGVNIFLENAVKKVYHIKRRPQDKPLSICLSKVEDLEKVAHLDDKTFNLAQELLPGPYTLILKKKDEISDLITAGSDKIGVRIPDSPVCQELAAEFPITTTSANISGEESLLRVDELVSLFQKEVDLFLDGGDCKNRSPSTVVGLTSSPPVILREGEGMESLTRLLEDLF